MSTPNFYIEHRAIVVLDEDYDNGNLPELSEQALESACQNCHYRHEVLGYGEFDFWTICITAGYYGDATIDYIRNEESSLMYDLTDGIPNYCESKLHFYEELSKLVKMSRTRFYQLTKGVYDLFEVGNIIADYLAKKEESQVNKALDTIKKDYGYTEIECAGVFSNGEAIYNKIA